MATSGLFEFWHPFCASGKPRSRHSERGDSRSRGLASAIPGNGISSYRRLSCACRNAFSVFLSHSVLVGFLFYAPPAQGQNSPATDDFLYAQKLLTEGYYELCLAQLEALRQRNPDAQEIADTWRMTGDANFALRRYEAATAAFRTFEVRYPFHQSIEDTRFKLAESLQAGGKLAEAASAYERVVAYHPRSAKAPLAQYHACVLWHRLRETQKARTGLYALMENYPQCEQHLPAQLLLVESFLASGEQARALQEADRLFRSFAQQQLTAQAHFIRGRAQEQVGQVQLAEESYLELLKKFPQSAWTSAAHARLAELQFARGDIAAAMTSLEKAAADTTNRSAKNYFALRAAQMQLGVGKIAEASIALQNFVAVKSDSAVNLNYYFILGQIEEGKGNRSAAAEAYQLATLLSVAAESKSDSAQAQPVYPRQRSFWRGAQVQVDDKNYAGAMRLCRQYRREYPQGQFRDALLFLEARTLQDGNGDLTQAQRLYDEMLNNYPRSAYVDEAQFELAKTYEAAGELQVARWQWQRFLQLYPASEHAGPARAHLRLLVEFSPADSPGSMAQISETLMKMQSGTPREELLLSLARLHFDRHEFEMALRYCRPLAEVETAAETARQSQYLMGACYHALSEAERLRGREAQAWRDSADTMLRLVAQADVTDRLSQAAGILLAHVAWEPPPPPSAAALARADSTLQVHDANPEVDGVRVWSAAARQPLAAPRDTTAYRQARHALEQVIRRENSPYYNQALLELAQWQWQSGDSAAAQHTLAQLESSNVKDLYQAQGQLLQARWLTAQKKYDAALAQLKSMRERYFYSAYADSAQALTLRVLILSGRVTEALQTLDAAGSQTNNFNDGADLARAQLLESTRNYSQAIQSYLRFLETHPQAPEAAAALVAAARLTYRAGAAQLAGGYYEECIRRFPGTDYSHEARFRLAEIQYDNNDFANARPIFWEAYNENPNGAYAKVALKQFIICLYKTKSVGQAETESKKFEEIYKNDRESIAELQYAAGEVALENKDFVTAERIFKKLRDFRDTPSGILGEYGLGKTLLIETKTEEALEILTGIPKRYPKHPFLPVVYLGLGDFYQTQQQWDNAIAAFGKVVQDSAFDNNYRVATRSLVDIYDRINLKDRALAQARHYVARFPDDPKTIDLQIKIGLLLIDLAQFDDAISHLRRLKPFADATTEPEIQYYIGKSHMNAGRFEMAIAELLRVKFFSKPTKLPWEVIALYDSAICYMRLHNCDMARKLFQQIVREQGAASEFGRFANVKIAELGSCQETN
ncbi:MAG: tetratricopeptide repeat protein [bacterium]